MNREEDTTADTCACTGYDPGGEDTYTCPHDGPCEAKAPDNCLFCDECCSEIWERNHRHT